MKNFLSTRGSMPQTMPTALAAKASFGDYTRCGARPTLHNDKRRNICENGPYKRPRIKRGLSEKERTLPPKMLLLNLAYKKRRKTSVKPKKETTVQSFDHM